MGVKPAFVRLRYERLSSIPPWGSRGAEDRLIEPAGNEAGLPATVGSPAQAGERPWAGGHHLRAAQPAVPSAVPPPRIPIAA